MEITFLIISALLLSLAVASTMRQRNPERIPVRINTNRRRPKRDTYL